MLARIKGLLLIIEFVITILIMIVLMYTFKKSNHKLRIAWAKMQSFIMGYKVIIKGKPDPEAKLLLMNHQSVVDIIAMEGIYPKNICWVAKQEIKNIPLFGHIITAPKMVAIDRKDKRSIIKIIKASKERIAEGRVMAMFPEGTRSDGTQILKFQQGGKILAEKLKLKVQPIVIVNTNNIFDSKKLLAKSGELSIIYLDAINPTDDEQWYEKTKTDMQRTLENELANYTSHR